MIWKRESASLEAIYATGKAMVTAAITAPKGSGQDDVDAILMDGEDKDKLVEIMHQLAVSSGHDFIERDAKIVNRCPCVVLIAAKDSPLGVNQCEFCGFKNCGANRKAGARCFFNIVDLGIAVGSACALAADNRIDNRVLYSAGKAAMIMGVFGDNCTSALAIPLSVASKSFHFDRESGDYADLYGEYL